MRLEGFELDERSKALYKQYIDGELTLAAVGQAIDELNNREFGSVSVPRRHRPEKTRAVSLTRTSQQRLRLAPHTGASAS